MTSDANATVDCRQVGEYVDEAELPPNLTVGHGEVVRPSVVAEYVELWGKDGVKEFTVLLKDGRILTVRGHSLKQLPPSAIEESGSYGIILRTGDEEALIALFKSIDVAGIFHGEMLPDRKIA